MRAPIRYRGVYRLQWRARRHAGACGRKLITLACKEARFACGVVVRFRLTATYFERAKVSKALGDTMSPNPCGGRKEKFAQPKSGKLARSWRDAALVVFMIVCE